MRNALVRLCILFTATPGAVAAQATVPVPVTIAASTNNSAAFLLGRGGGGRGRQLLQRRKKAAEPRIARGIGPSAGITGKPGPLQHWFKELTRHEREIGPASPSPPTEAYALMWYGETRSRSFDGLKVVVQSVRSFDANREIVLMTPVKDPEARTNDPMLLALQQSTPRIVIERVPLRTIFRNTSVTCTDKRGKQCGSKGSRSYVFTYSKFGLWNLTRWSRLMYLDIDLLVTRSLEPLWEARIGAGNAFVAASYAIKAKTGKNPVGGQKAEFPCNGKSRGWHQAIGYNTGLLLLQPSQIVAEAIFHEMKNSWRWSYKSPCRSDQTYFNILFDRYVPLTRCFPYSANCRDPKFINSSSAPDPSATVSKLSRCLEPLGGEGAAPPLELPFTVHFSCQTKPWLPENSHLFLVRKWREHLAAINAKMGLPVDPLPSSHQAAPRGRASISSHLPIDRAKMGRASMSPPADAADSNRQLRGIQEALRLLVEQSNRLSDAVVSLTSRVTQLGQAQESSDSDDGDRQLSSQGAYPPLPPLPPPFKGSCTTLPGQLPPPPEDPTNRKLWRRVLDDVLLPGRAAASWNNYYDDLSQLLRWKMDAKHEWSREKCSGTDCGRPMASMRSVEIGTMYGGASDRILRRLPSTLEHFVVDPFLAGYDDKGDVTSVRFATFAKDKGVPREHFSLAWAEAMAYDFRRHFGCRYHLFHAKSLEGAPHFENNSLDAIFIDGLHTYEGLLDDIRAWWPKLSTKGGLMIFNDYGSRAFPGVQKAVQTFMSPLGLQVKVGKLGKPPGHRNAYVVRWK